MYGKTRDMAPYNQIVFGTTTIASQAVDTARHLRTQAHQLATAAGVVEDCYRLLLGLQCTTQYMADAAPSPEYAKTVSRYRY